MKNQTIICSILLPLVLLSTVKAEYLPDTPITQADAYFYAVRWDGQAGYSLDCVGDVNGDGYDDFVTGAYSDPQYGEQGGNAFLIFGADNFQNTILDDADVKFTAGDNYDNYGLAVCGAGDVNGDDLDDFLISGFNVDSGGGDYRGAAFLFLGRENWPDSLDYSQADGSFIGEQAFDQAGYALAGGGDVNGDELSDFIIGANTAIRNEEHFLGRAYLFFGDEEGFSLNTPLNEADVVFPGIEEYGNLGFAMDIIGDTDGDTLDDILISAPIASTEDYKECGITYLIKGRYNWTSVFDLNESDAIFAGDDDFCMSGTAVYSAGDLNNDGLADFAIGAPYADPDSLNEGAVYLFFGQETLWEPMTSIAEADVRFMGEDTSNHVGMAIYGAEDINQDNISDLLIGVPSQCEGGASAGQVYLIYGRITGWLTDFPLSQADASFIGVTPHNIGENAGRAVASGDFDNNGLADIIIGAPNNTQGGRAAGKVYLFLTQ